MERFAMARGGGTRFLWPFVRGRQEVEVTEGRVRLHYGALGRFDVPAAMVDRLSRVRWPWWAGLGVRIAYRMVAYVGRSGQIAVLELSDPVSVRMPVNWSTRRIGVAVEDVDGFLRAVAAERARADLEGTGNTPDAPA